MPSVHLPIALHARIRDDAKRHGRSLKAQALIVVAAGYGDPAALEQLAADRRAEAKARRAPAGVPC